MKGSTIAFAALGIMNFGLAGLKYAANRHASKAALEKAIASRTEEASDIYQEAKNRCDLYHDLMDREKKAMNAQKQKWMAEHDFAARKKDILDSAASGLTDFKDQIGYSNKMEELEDAFQSSVDAFKASIDYDHSKRNLEEVVSEAKSHYESQKAAFDLAGDDISETTMKLRHAAEESMNAKVKEAKGKLDALDKQLKDETDKLTQKKLDDIRALEEKVSKEKIRLDKKTNKDLEKLNDELSTAEESIRNSIRKARSKEERMAISEHDNDLRIFREQHAIDQRVADELFEATPMDARVGEYLKMKKVPKFVVPVVGVISFVPAGYLLYIWGKFLVGVMKAM